METWMIVVSAIGFLFILGIAWFAWEIKNDPLMEECSLCDGAVCLDKIKHMRKDGHHPIAACPYCLAEAKEQGFEVYEISA